MPTCACTGNCRRHGSCSGPPPAPVPGSTALDGRIVPWTPPGLVFLPEAAPDSGAPPPVPDDDAIARALEAWGRLEHVGRARAMRAAILAAIDEERG
jgi:hypothetical protein